MRAWMLISVDDPTILEKIENIDNSLVVERVVGGDYDAIIVFNDVTVDRLIDVRKLLRKLGVVLSSTLVEKK